MAEYTDYPPGVPCWIDLASPDVEASKAFYGAVFGWTAEDQGPESGGYHQFKIGDKYVAGLGPTQSEQQPPAWSTYIRVEDAEATIAAAKEAGGTIALDPFDVLDAGRMAVFIDPTGAFLSLWQPGRHRGAQLANEQGTLSWNELNTRDPDAAKAFYGAVFGWEGVTHEMGPTSYTEWKLDGRSIGGMIDITDRVPPQVPAHWLVYFAVADMDATVATAREQGGSVMVGPIDIPQGRFAVLTDPQGAAFAVIKLAG